MVVVVVEVVVALVGVVTWRLLFVDSLTTVGLTFVRVSPDVAGVRVVGGGVGGAGGTGAEGGGDGGCVGGAGVGGGATMGT